MTAIVFGLLLSPMLFAADPIKLTDYQVMPININQPFEPSGLTLKDGQLFTVCDDSNAIYALNVIDENNAEAVVHQHIDVTQLAALNLDMEALTTVGDDFFAVSETHHKLIHIKDDQVTWVPDLGGVYASAFAAGLFQIYNAGMEAVVYLDNNTFLLSVERQPRGLIEVVFDQDFNKILNQTNQIIDDSQYPIDASRKPDLTGLYVYEGVIYALHRNAYLIHELTKDQNGLYQEGRAWSYEHIVKDPENAYQDMQYGHAEGLAVDGDFFYLVLDNNNQPKLKKPNDIRPLLIKAKR